MNQEELEKMINGLAIDQGKLSTRVDSLCGQFQETKTLVESVHELALSVRELTLAQQGTSKQVEQLRTDVDEIQKNPGKKWESLKSVIIAAIATGIVGYFLGTFLK